MYFLLVNSVANVDTAVEPVTGASTFPTKDHLPVSGTLLAPMLGVPPTLLSTVTAMAVSVMYKVVLTLASAILEDWAHVFPSFVAIFATRAAGAVTTLVARIVPVATNARLVMVVYGKSVAIKTPFRGTYEIFVRLVHRTL